jgi:hypothetical protein
MPNFRVDDLDIEPHEFVDSCSRSERRELIDYLIEGGHISKERGLNLSNGVKNPNINDELYLSSLNVLSKSRHLLSIEEEEMINKLAEKFKYLY